MTILRAPRPTSGYTLIRDVVLRDGRLSYRARGVLVSILSRPDNWIATAEQLAEEGTEGRDAIRKAMAELEACGYIVRRNVQGSDGRWSNQSVVHDTPVSPGPENPFPVTENPRRNESPGPEKPAPENQGRNRTTDKEQPTTSLRSVVPPKRGSRIDPSWMPTPELIGQMQAECPTIDLQAEHRKFIDYWISKPGRDGTKLDWPATWRNWIRNAKPAANGHNRYALKRQEETDEHFNRMLAHARERDRQLGLTNPKEITS